jgi:hypothetical protein
MDDITTGRLEPTTPVVEPVGQQPRHDPGSESRRRPPHSVPSAPEPEPAEDSPAKDSDGPPHQVDRMA